MIGAARGLVLLALACGLPGCGGSESPAAAFQKDPEAVKRGRLVFIGTCGAYCHSLQPGVRDAPYLFDCHWKHGGEDADLFRVIAEGVPDTRMIGFGGKLPDGDTDIWKVVAFLRSKRSCGL